MAKTKQRRGVALEDVCAALEAIAPTRLAQKDDNVGLIAGDGRARITRALLCIDLTAAVAAEAKATPVELVVAYHPPIFRPIQRLVARSTRQEDVVFDCVAHGIAIYTPHTALDAARGGTNDVLAEVCGVVDAQPLERPIGPARQHKLVVFVPAEHEDRVADALFAAGAGRIGAYESCSFRAPGTGTFFPTASANPVIGAQGRIERVAEVRLEVVCDTRRLAAVLDALRGAHPYEEVAFDVYPLSDVAALGIGRVGRFARPVTLARLVARLKRRTGARCVAFVGDPEARCARAVIAVGAAGSLPFSQPLGPGDVIVTGEMRHHDALALERRGACAIALSHWSSERPALAALGAALEARVPGLSARLSQADREPFVRA
jgi:dinuclear metal center YbgI/SA1388 family protein